MRISELAEASGVSLPTLKYYLREGLLMPGVATARTRAEYDEAHLERLRLVRALVESGGLGIAAVRAVIAALDDPPASPHELLGVAHHALPPPVEPVAPSAEVVGWMRELGWESCLHSPLLGALTRAVADVRAAGVPLPDTAVRAYADAALRLAAVDVAIAARAPSPAAALHTVVVGTVMIDPLVAILRRLAQEVESSRVLGA
ncbi:MerR family transcriptional regulator [Nocardioides aurantiacus]|uniref:MerR-like DNA binding protein n=1 Tax=Nocardioides aurantiacus TaxID=86796 RepID=A0A3N2CQ65_9ACTN|nr:MerR family transcriptional regulator [Nocardioides aurantiacus]ROR89548.1 MerR-like DNA binding protein [Nocardioides aurantiacus]